MDYRKFNQHMAGGVYVILCAPVVYVLLDIHNSTTSQASVVASEITSYELRRLYSGPTHVMSEVL